MNEQATVGNLAKSVNELFVLDEQKKKIDEERKSICEKQRKIEEYILTIFAEENLSTFDAEKGRVFHKVTTTAKMVDKNAFRSYLGADKWNALATIHSRTLTKFVKDELTTDLALDLPEKKFPGVEVGELIQLAKRRK